MGMPKIEFRCQMFRGDWDQVWSQERMLHLMEALVRVNQTHLQEFETFKKRGLVADVYPSVYRSGLHYETEKGTEIWPDIPSLLEGTMGAGVYPGFFGDCEDLACYRCAELRELPAHYERPSKAKKGATEGADPRYPQEPSAIDAQAKNRPWPGWKLVKGGIAAKPFAKWRRGPQGQYHYHAIVRMPDGQLEDPSLVLGMGKERDFAESDMARRLKAGEMVILRYAKKPDVMVVDPEKPSGYNGGKASELDKEVLKKMSVAAPGASVTSGDLESGAYLGNPIPVSDGNSLDALMGWSQEHKLFVPQSVEAELRRLRGYSS
jgi:hypothetical protein